MSETASRPTFSSAGIIRRALGEDAPAIEALYGELVADPQIRVLPEQVAALSESRTSFLLVAESAGTVCGTVLLTICPDAMYRTQPFGVVENIVVAQSQRGRGIGRLLLARVERLAQDHHCTKLMLMSGSNRVDAHAFFRSCGFSSDTKHAFVKYRRQFDLH